MITVCQCVLLKYEINVKDVRVIEQRLVSSIRVSDTNLHVVQLETPKVCLENTPKIVKMPNSKSTEKSSKRARIVSSSRRDLHLSPSTKGKEKAKISTEPKTTLPTSFKVIAGSYEKLLYGLDGSVSPNEDCEGYKFELKPSFIFPAHVSCIKAVAASPNGGKWLATGSADEVIKVWDLRRKKEIGGLMHHDGASMCSTYSPNTNGSDRVHNPAPFPLPLAPPLCVRRRFIMPVPCSRLGCASYTQRSQRTRQFYSGAPVQ